jgi:ABC-type transporter Mla subunit MlaD
MRWPWSKRRELVDLERRVHTLEQRTRNMATKDDLDNAIAALEGDLAPITQELADLKAQLAAALAAGTSVPQEAIDRVTALHAKFAALAPAAPAAPTDGVTTSPG